MKRKILLVFWCLLLLLVRVGNLRATDSVRIRCLDDETSGNDPLPIPVRHVFGGAPVAFRVWLEAPTGSRVQLRADLSQLTSGGLAAPLQKDVPVSPELTFETDAPRTLDGTLPAVPDPKAPTRIRVTLRACAGESPVVLASAAMEIVVYPTEKPDEWKNFFAAGLKQSGLARLAVFGRGKVLGDFLRDRHVSFDDLGVDWPVNPTARTLYVAENPPARPTRVASTEGWRLVLFLPPSEDELPMVYRSVDARDGVTAKVVVPGLLEHLPDDPRRARILAEIFRFALDLHAHITTPTPDPPDPP